MEKTKRLCDEDCRNCALINRNDPNVFHLALVLNRAYEKFGDEFYAIVEDACPNLTCCPECAIDDFTHDEDGCVVTDAM